MSLVAEAQLEEIPEIRVQNKVYDGRVSKNAGRESTLTGQQKDDSSYGSDSDAEDCQFDFEEQSDQDLRVPEVKQMSHEPINRDKKDAVMSSIQSLKLAQDKTRPNQGIKAVSVEVSEVDQTTSLSEVIESKFKNLTILTSYTKNNPQGKADLKDEVDSGQGSRKTVGAEEHQDNAGSKS